MKKSLLLLTCLLFSRLLSAQILGEPASIQSPNTANLGLYGEMPVSLFTGMPSIEVPLYTVEEGPLKVPLSLSYHASGFRPDMHPGWVGMGWSLASGGVVTRSVRDIPDEYDNSNQLRDQGTQAGYYFHRWILNPASPTDWTSTSYMQSVARSNESKKDTEPDEFSFDFNGYSGKFYLNTDGSWKVKCDKPLLVSPFVPSQTSPFAADPFPVSQASQTRTYGKSMTFVGFTVTTEDGTQYVFGGTTSAIEYEMGLFSQNTDEWVANSWYLTQIIHPDGHSISFTYERVANEWVCQMYNNIFSNIKTQAIRFDNTKFDACSSTSIQALYTSYSGKLLAPVYLTGIQTSTTNVFFDRAFSPELPYDPNFFSYRLSQNSAGFAYVDAISPYYPDLSKFKWQKLTNIRVVAKASAQPIKSFKFSYNNDTPTASTANERLTLLQVTEQGSGGATKPPYRFGYNKYHNLPSYLANKTDHWGFYNATYAVADYTNYASYYGYREANTDSAVYLAGMLTRIKYPTGGITDFLYEQHSFGRQLDEYRFLPPSPTTGGDKPAGGVRIKKITSYSPDNPTQKLEKEYLYVSNYSPSATGPLPSSGILGGRARYVFDDYRGKAYNDPDASISYYTRSIFSTQSVLPACTNSRGSHIGYSTVVEKRSDGSYTQYLYSNFDTNLDEVPLNVLQPDSHSRTLYSPYTSKDEERGKLLQERLFTNQGTLVKQRTITYIAQNKDTEYVPSMNAFNFPTCPGSGSAPSNYPPSNNYVSSDEGTAYKFYTYSYLPNQETETVYDANGANGITSIKNTLYNSHRLVQSEKEIDSKGITLETQYKYSFDFPYNGPQPYIGLTRGMASMGGIKNMVGYPIQILRLRNGKLTGATVALYSEFQLGHVLPSQLLELIPTQPLDMTQYTQPSFSGPTSSNYQQFVTDAKLLPKLTFNSYDDKSNILGLAKEGNQLSSYQWGYNKTLLVAKTDNALASEVFSSNFEEDKVVATAAADVAGTWYSPGNYLKFEASPSDLNHPSTRKAAHTGQLAGAMYTGYPGEQAHAFSTTLTVPARTGSRRYVFSGWVYTNGPQASIWLFPNLPSARNADGTTNYYDGINNSARPDLAPVLVGTQLDVKPDQLGRWVYLQKEVDVPGDATLLTMRITNFWNGAGSAAATANGGGVWFDDVRMHPAEAQMTTYTHQLGIGVTSISDANNRPVTTEFDALNRLNVVRDQDGNIIKQIDYHYQR